MYRHQIVILLVFCSITGCVPMLAPTPMPRGTGTEFSVSGGTVANVGGTTSPRVQLAGQRYWYRPGGLRLDTGFALVLPAAHRAAAIMPGLVLRAGHESRHLYLGAEVDLGLLYGGVGPVIAAGNGPVWVFSGARAVAMPGNWYGAYYAHTQDRFAGGLLVPVGFSISMSDLLALQVMGDWIWFPGDGTQHLRANVGFAFRGDW